MPPGAAAEVTLQLMLQESHKWVYTPPKVPGPRPTSSNLMPKHADLHKPDMVGIVEDNVSEVAAELAQQADNSSDEALEEEYTEEVRRRHTESPLSVLMHFRSVSLTTHVAATRKGCCTHL